MFDGRESEELSLTPELELLERQLAGLDIAPVQLDRDRLMFDAGRAAERRDREFSTAAIVVDSRRWHWPAATAMMTAACVMLAAMLVWRDDASLIGKQQAKPQAVELRFIEKPTREDLREVERLAANAGQMMWPRRPAGGYLEKRYIALTRGVSEMQPADEGTGSLQPHDSKHPSTARDLFRELISPSGFSS